MKGLWSCYFRMAFLDGDTFCKAFAKLVPIQKNYIVVIQDLLNHVPFMLCRLANFNRCEFWIFHYEKIAHENLVDTLGRHEIWDQYFHGC